MIDGDYYQCMAVANRRERRGASDGVLSEEMVEFIDHLAALLAQEYAAAVMEERDAGSGVCEILEREPTRAEH
jgi:hypothetical protein